MGLLRKAAYGLGKGLEKAGEHEWKKVKEEAERASQRALIELEQRNRLEVQSISDANADERQIRALDASAAEGLANRESEERRTKMSTDASVAAARERKGKGDDEDELGNLKFKDVITGYNTETGEPIKETVTEINGELFTAKEILAAQSRMKTAAVPRVTAPAAPAGGALTQASQLSQGSVPSAPAAPVEAAEAVPVNAPGRGRAPAPAVAPPSGGRVMESPEVTAARSAMREQKANLERAISRTSDPATRQALQQQLQSLSAQ